jgi:hypothetical protein
MLYVVSDIKSEHYGKYVKKIYMAGDDRWACQTFDNSEKMFIKDNQLMAQQDFENQRMTSRENWLEYQRDNA